MSEARSAWDAALSYYLGARALDVNAGKLHNQLAVVEEQRQGDGLGVCMGACVRFALATAAVKPYATAETNLRRCIGNHRDALAQKLPPPRLAALSPDNMCAAARPLLARGARAINCLQLGALHSLVMHSSTSNLAMCMLLRHHLSIARVHRRKFTHLVQTATMLLASAFGSGFDGVDLDKAAARWHACKPLLAHLFADAAYPKAAAFRDLHQDFGAQTALFACLSLWCCQAAMQSCADQVSACVLHRRFTSG